MELGSKTFGQYFAEVRRETLGVSLRAFCAEHGFDPGNVSKLERGRVAPPASEETLSQYADALGLSLYTKERELFMDLAAAERGRIPEELRTDEVIARLPVLFRALRDKPIDEEFAEKLAEKIRSS